jgi:hypothetical protein
MMSLSVVFRAPFNGSLAGNGTIIAWLLPHLMESPLWERGAIDELDLFDFIVAAEPRWHALITITLERISPVHYDA